MSELCEQTAAPSAAGSRPATSMRLAGSSLQAISVQAIRVQAISVHEMLSEQAISIQVATKQQRQQQAVGVLQQQVRWLGSKQWIRGRVEAARGAGYGQGGD